MKTIFIPIQQRPQARNVLRTDILKTLQAAKNVRIVIFAPRAKIAQYQKECASPNTIFEELDMSETTLSRTDAFFGRISLFYINSSTSRMLRKQWLWHARRQPFRYVFSLALLHILGSHSFLRSFLRWCDLSLVRDERLSRFFDTYKPDLVFSPSTMYHYDRSFLRHAKKRKIPTVGTVLTWDNITIAKYSFRVLPDTMIAYNETIKKEIICYLDQPAHTIEVTGIPHYDFYTNSKRAPREEFCAQLGIDPHLRIILFASVGSIANPTEWQTLSLLVRAHEEKKLPKDTIIIFRQHPTERAKIENIPENTYVILDDSKTTLSDDDETFSEILSKDMEHLADSLHHASLLVTTTSSMSIDASVFDTPVINIAFDGWEQRPIHLSVRRKFLPNYAHYHPIIQSGGVRVARTPEELIEAVNAYLNDPTLDCAGRERIVRDKCYKMDGKAGGRIGKFIIKQI